MSYRGRIPNNVQDIIDNLHRMMGDITTEEQVAKASKFHARLKLSSDHHSNERRAGETFLQKSVNVDGARAWEEIMLYRSIAHGSVFFVPEQIGNDILDAVSVQELASCAVGWIRLVFEGRLGDLAPELVDFQKGKPPARGLKRFMNEFKSDIAFDVWNIRRIQALKHTIYDVVHAEGAKKYVGFAAAGSPESVERMREDLEIQTHYTTAETQTELYVLDEPANLPLPTTSDRLIRLQEERATEGPFNRQLREKIEAIYALRTSQDRRC